MHPRSDVRPGRGGELTPLWRAGRALATALGLLLLVLGSGAGTALAHDTLVGSDPPAGAVLDAAPGSLVLTFSSGQLDVGAAVAVTGPDGSDWADGAPVVDGPTVTQALAPQMPSGAYVAEWRSVSADGHPISGSFSFTLAVPEQVATEATPDATPEPEVGGATPSAPTGEVDDRGSRVEDARSPSGIIDDPWIAAALALAVVAGVATTIVRRRRANGPRAAQDGEDQEG